MTQEKTKLREDIQKLKKKGLSLTEISNMYRGLDGLHFLMLSSDKSMKELKESVGTTRPNWDLTLKGCYNKLERWQISRLAKALDLPFEQVNEVIKIDIENQKK